MSYLLCVLLFLSVSVCFCLLLSYQDQGGEQGEDYETEEQLQARILTAALEFVPIHGWSVEAIAAGAEVRRGPAVVQTQLSPRAHSSQICRMSFESFVGSFDHCNFMDFTLRKCQPFSSLSSTQLPI